MEVLNRCLVVFACGLMVGCGMALIVFWGDLRYERALCAGITIKTFSVDMVERLEKRWDDLPETGFKVGVASSRLLVKRIGTPRNPAQQEPVWAGSQARRVRRWRSGPGRKPDLTAASRRLPAWQLTLPPR